MLFAIHALDKPDVLERRLAHYPDHRAFLADTSAYGVRIVMSGPLVAEDGERMIGSLFVVEAADQMTVEKFNQADPFQKAEIWQQITITGFIRRQG
jgi:hypothetical protein